MASGSHGDGGSWQESPADDGGDVRRWLTIVSAPSMTLGRDERGEWVRYVPQTGRLVSAGSDNLLFFLPLLDMEPGEFLSQLTFVEGYDEALRTEAETLVQGTIRAALKERADSYIERALVWLEQIGGSAETRVWLADLAHSRRGTQKQRHKALSILKRNDA